MGQSQPWVTVHITMGGTSERHIRWPFPCQKRMAPMTRYNITNPQGLQYSRGLQLAKGMIPLCMLQWRLGKTNNGYWLLCAQTCNGIDSYCNKAQKYIPKANEIYNERLRSSRYEFSKLGVFPWWPMMMWNHYCSLYGPQRRWVGNIAGCYY